MSSKSAPRRRQREAVNDALETGRAYSARSKPLIRQLSLDSRPRKGASVARVSEQIICVNNRH